MDTLFDQGLEMQDDSKLKTSSSLSYDFEMENKVNLTALTYMEGLKAVQRRGYTRFLTPQEYGRLVVDYLENKLSGKEAESMENLIDRGGSWLSGAVLRNNDTFSIYINPVGLRHRRESEGNEGYFANNLEFSESRLFRIPESFKHDTRICLGDLSDEFSEFIYGKPFDELPKEMRRGGKKAFVEFSGKSSVNPCACFFSPSIYGLDFSRLYVSTFGVRE